jgi:lipoprotein-releasing system ATP-binding protein
MNDSFKNHGLPIRLQNVSKTYQKGGRDIHVLRDVSIEIGAGEAVSIVGPSGCGKSTLLHLLGTLDRPTSGDIFYGNQCYTNASPAELDAARNQMIGFVFQFHHLLPEQTARGNVAMPLLIRGMPRAEANLEADAVLHTVGLADRLSHRPGELSGGEQQRVAIARALVTRPGLLLADEPTGNLDPKTAEEVFESFLTLNSSLGSTLVVVTHSLELASRFPRRLRVVDGRLEEN